MIRGRTDRTTYFRRGGLTLVEVLMAVAVLEVAVTAVTFAVVAGRDRSESGRRALVADNLGEALLEEILSLPYDDPDGVSRLGPEPGESRRMRFDNADDFHGYRDRPADIERAGLPPFERSVAMTTGGLTVPALGRTVPGLTVNVTVRDEQRAWAVTRFIPEPAP